MPGTPVHISDDILREIYEHARSTFPEECCGWLIGAEGTNKVTRVRPALNAYEASTHPTIQDRTRERAFVITGAELLELARSLDSSEPALVIFHSHPNGAAYFSETDQAVAGGPWGEPAWPVQHMVVGLDKDRVVEARLFDWDTETQRFEEIATLPGATI